MAAGCRSLPSDRASWRGSPPAMASSTGSTGRAGGSTPPRSRSSSPNTVGVASPARCSAITQCWVWRDSTGTICSPRPVPSAVPPCSANVTSLPSSAARPDSSSRDRSSFHSADRPTSAAAASALPPAMPPGHRDALAQDERDVGIPVGALGEQLDRAPGEVGLVGGHLRDPFAVHRDGGLGVDRDRDLVEQADGVEHGDEVVEAVVAQPADLQMEVDLGGDPHRDRRRDGGQHAPTLRRDQLRAGSTSGLRGARCRGRAKHSAATRPMASTAAGSSNACAIAALKPACRAGGSRAAASSTWPPRQLGGDPRLHEHGDARAAQHRPDLAGGVVDTRGGARLAHRQVAGGRGGDRRPHVPVGHADERDRPQQHPDRAWWRP